MNRITSNVLSVFTRVSQPHLSKMMGGNRPINIDWVNDPNPRPPHLPFNPFDESQRGISPGIKHSKNGERGWNDKRGPDKRRPYRILCLDGGGVRGILTVALLSRIIEHSPDFLDQLGGIHCNIYTATPLLVDLIVGTSAGGILSLLIAAGYSPKKVEDIYSYCAPHIFGHNPWRVINPWKSKYSDKNKEDIMKHYFQDKNMVDLKKTCAVVAFRLDGRRSKTHSFFNKEGWRPAVFSNMPRASGTVDPDSELKVWDAAMRTSAAPTFFPVFRGYTDGGIVANNPSIIAVSKAMAHFHNVTPRNVTVLSLGAGIFPRHTNVFSAGQGAPTNAWEQGSSDTESTPLWRADWGIKQWIPFLLDLLLDGDSITTEMVMHYLLGGNGLYHRLDPQLPRPIALDDVNSMNDLREFAQTVDLTDTFKFVDENFAYDPLNSVDDNMGYNSLDSASDYHEAWAR